MINFKTVFESKLLKMNQGEILHVGLFPLFKITRTPEWHNKYNQLTFPNFNIQNTTKIILL